MTNDIHRITSKSAVKKFGAAKHLKAIGLAFLLAGQACAQGDMHENPTLYRDAYGSPYIVGETMSDAFYGVGYAYAEDKAEAYYHLVLMGIGEWAKYKGDEITFLGAPASAIDGEAKRWRHAEKAKATYDRLDGFEKAALDAFVEGFEAYFKDHPEEKPAWAPTLEGWHPIAAVRGIMWPFSVASQGQADCRAGGIQVANANPLDQVAARLASNQWMVAPDKTDGGFTAHLTDPHGPVDGGLIFSEFTILVGDYAANVYGLGPIPITAATRDLAWGATTGGPDVADCYAVEFIPGSPNEYMFDGERRTIQEQTETIEVKDGESIQQVYQFIEQNGIVAPVVGRDEGHFYVVNTPYMDVGGLGAVQLLGLLKAESVDDALKVVEDPELFTQNFVFADKAGNGLFLHMGRAPIRPEGYDWGKPVPGNSSETQWLGVHSANDLVSARVSGNGYLKNTNEAPEHVMATNSPIDPADYPDYLYTDPGFVGARAYRLGKLLENNESLTLAALEDIVFDEYLPHSGRWLAALKQAAEGCPCADGLTDGQQAFLEDVLSFDGYMDKDSSNAAKYYLWRRALWATLEKDTMLGIYGPGDPEGSVGDLPAEVLEILISGIIEAETSKAGNDVVLGDVFRMARAAESYPLGGATVCGNARGQWCEETLRAFNAFGPMNQDGFISPQYGGRMIRLTVFGEEPQIFTAFNFGQSNKPGSDHYTDQAGSLFSNKQLKQIYLNLEELKANIVTEQILVRSKNK